MIHADAIMSQIRAIQTSLFIQKQSLIIIYKQLGSQDKRKSVDIAKVKQTLRIRYQQRQKLYHAVYDIVNKLSQENIDLTPEQRINQSEIFGILNVENAVQKPVLVSKDLKINVSAIQERIVHRATKSIFYAQQKFYYELAKLDQQRDDKDKIEYQVSEYKYLDTVKNDNYYDYTTMQQLFDKKAAIIQGIYQASEYFSNQHNKYFSNNVERKYNSKNKLIYEWWEKYLLKLGIQSRYLFGTLRQLENQFGRSTIILSLDQEIDIQKGLQNMFFVQEQLPQVITAIGLQIFSTQECELIRHNMLPCCKRYEHMCFSEKPESSVQGQQEQGSAQEPEWKQYIQEPMYIVCCPGCCVPDNYVAHFLRSHHNRDHARSCVSGKVLLYKERLMETVDRVSSGFCILKGLRNSQECIGYITPTELFRKWHQLGTTYAYNKKD